jgi:Holliday junction resolvase RusA-like endonuclease
MTSLAFTIPGNPIPKERPRVVRRKGWRGKGPKTITITPKRTTAYEAHVRDACVEACRSFKRVMGAAWPTDARYSVTLLVVRDSKRAADCDNFAKSICDGAKGALWDDDSQIDHLVVQRGGVDKAHPRVVLMVRVVTAGEMREAAARIEASAA